MLFSDGFFINSQFNAEAHYIIGRGQLNRDYTLQA
jgi:hypothetical protein